MGRNRCVRRRHRLLRMLGMLLQLVVRSSVVVLRLRLLLLNRLIEPSVLRRNVPPTSLSLLRLRLRLRLPSVSMPMTVPVSHPSIPRIRPSKQLRRSCADPHSDIDVHRRGSTRIRVRPAWRCPIR